jgi:hypothetical protein
MSDNRTEQLEALRDALAPDWTDHKDWCDRAIAALREGEAAKTDCGGVEGHATDSRPGTPRIGGSAFPSPPGGSDAPNPGAGVEPGPQSPTPPGLPPMAKRYGLDMAGFVGQQHDGNLVRFSDYESLHDQLREALGEVEKMRADRDRLQAACENHIAKRVEEKSRADAAEAERDARRREVADLELILPSACGSLKDAAETLTEERDALRAEVEALKAQEPVAGEKFVRGWLSIDELPGGMMVSNSGRFGPVPALTSCCVTTSEKTAAEWRERGKPALEVWTAPAPAREPEARLAALNEAIGAVESAGGDNEEYHVEAIRRLMEPKP